MTKKQELLRNRKIQLLRSSNRLGSHANCFRAYSNETQKHKRLKFEVWLILTELGCTVYTEGIFLDGNRCDILAIFPDGRTKVIEILSSETYEECSEKVKKYPKNIDDILIISELNDKTRRDIEC